MTNSKISKFFNLKILYISFLLISIIMVIVLPQIAINSFFGGISIWATKVLPALLPFFILTKLLSSTSFLTYLGKYLSPITRRLYGVGGVSGYIYVMSIISGYPVGAKITSDFYLQNIITSGQAKTITSFTSTSGPLFIIGTVAIGMYENTQIGLIIIISHMFGAILNGLIYKNHEKTDVKNIYSHTSNFNLGDAMTSSIMSIMLVGGFIAIFYMLLQIINYLNIFSPITKAFKVMGVDENIIIGILSGLIEVTSGCLHLSKLALSPKILAIISTFLISFGGFAIHAQAYTFLQNAKIKYKTFLLQKTTQAIISTILAIILACVIL